MFYKNRLHIFELKTETLSVLTCEHFLMLLAIFQFDLQKRKGHKSHRSSVILNCRMQSLKQDFENVADTLMA
jgi:hypothetical protein